MTQPVTGQGTIAEAAAGAQFCELHCALTWQCSICGALVHGKSGQAAHRAWHEKHGEA